MSDSLPLVLGVTALMGSLMAAGLAFYLFWSRRPSKSEPRQAEPATRPEPAKERPSPVSGGSVRRAQSAKAYSLFVIFAEPSAETQAALVAWLRKVEARYDHVFEVFNVAGEQPANPVKVANAFPPGTLPDLLAGEGASPLRGISLLVKPPLRASRNQQMHVFVALARQLEALGGQVLDADRQPATEATYAVILGE